MNICHKIGEPYEVVVWTTCLDCTLDSCVIWRLTRQYVIPKSSRDTHEVRSQEETQ